MAQYPNERCRISRGASTEDDGLDFIGVLWAHSLGDAQDVTQVMFWSSGSRHGEEQLPKMGRSSGQRINGRALGC